MNTDVQDAQDRARTTPSILLSQGGTLNTSHGQFFLPSALPDQPPIAVVLRGVNLSSSSKYPASKGPQPELANGVGDRHARDQLRQWEAGIQTYIDNEDVWNEAKEGGRDGWFVGHPLQEADCTVRYDISFSANLTLTHKSFI